MHAEISPYESIDYTAFSDENAESSAITRHTGATKTAIIDDMLAHASTVLSLAALVPFPLLATIVTSAQLIVNTAQVSFLSILTSE